MKNIKGINKLKEMVAYLIPVIVVMYILPLFGVDIVSRGFITLLAIPAMCFLTAFVYAIKKGFDVNYAIMVAVLFTPTLFIYYTSSALIFISIYGILALVALILGSVFHKEKAPRKPRTVKATKKTKKIKK